MKLLLLVFASQACLISCSPLIQDPSSSPPTVTLDSATVTGVNQGSLSKFLGIPFAASPVGDLRFRGPQPLSSYNGSINATFYGPSCPQQTVKFPIGLDDIFNISSPLIDNILFLRNSSNSSSTPESEDCLTINVIKPSNVSADAKLPVLVWIFGGGFERGNAGSYDEQATRIVNRSMELGQPVIYAAMNYRVSAWGFLASQEVKDAGDGNMGLVDQYVALQWVNKYINLFGGDSSKVTIWGQSAGAISASLHMMAYGGNSSSLFRGAFMQSGAPIPVGNLTGGQPYYDQLVNETNCAGSNNTLDCLRKVPYDSLKKAVDNTPNYFSYNALVLAWSPRADGVFLQDNPQRLIQQGKVTNTSIVSGNVDDEGTLFSLSSNNVTTDEQFQEYINTIWVPGANSSDLEPLWTYYPANTTDGSPFNTSDFNAITPQYKRVSAFQGDVVFQAPRRFFLDHLSGKQKIWSYLSWRLKLTPVLGSFHASDLETGLLDDYIVQFVNKLDPNNGTGVLWPQYTSESPQLYTFPTVGNPRLSNDTYREAPMQYLTNLSLAFPL